MLLSTARFAATSMSRITTPSGAFNLTGAKLSMAFTPSRASSHAHALRGRRGHRHYGKFYALFGKPGKFAYRADRFARHDAARLFGVAVEGAGNAYAVLFESAVSKQRPAQFTRADEHGLLFYVAAEVIFERGDKLLTHISHLGPAHARGVGQVFADENLAHAERRRYGARRDIFAVIPGERTQIIQIYGQSLQRYLGDVLFHNSTFIASAAAP